MAHWHWSRAGHQLEDSLMLHQQTLALEYRVQAGLVVKVLIGVQIVIAGCKSYNH
ncbi:hypothetical protein [Segatella copri]|uniref:hypothetical protein n=1 Tax=Segatella copri TaxID=165179 RepID=UPI002FF20D3C